MVELEACSLFRPLKPAELQELRKSAQERSFGEGAEIFKQGDTGDGLYVVKEGRVQISGQVGENARHVFSQVNPGRGVRRDGGVGGQKLRSAAAVAEGPTTVLPHSAGTRC